MKTESFIKTNIETTVQGISVVVMTEYKQNETPSIYTCNVSGQIDPIQEGDPGKWFNVSSVLNIGTQDVQVNTSGSVPVGFLAALEVEMMAAHEFVMAEINAKTMGHEI